MRAYLFYCRVTTTTKKVYTLSFIIFWIATSVFKNQKLGLTTPLNDGGIRPQ